MGWHMIFLSAFLINNIVLIRFLGLCSFFGVSNQFDTALGMSMAVTFVMTMASIVTWFAWHFILLPLHLEFLKIALFILVIAALVQLIELYLKKMIPTIYEAMGIFLPLITTNCAILGLALLNIDYSLSFFNTIVYSLGVAMGYSLAILIFSGIRERIDIAPIPHILQGSPIIFIMAGLMSMIFLGFSHLFGL
ncbi:MAG: RnfABCDGE type electron transport complex subunit A [Nitrospinae bacterium]|nr:RnfABCDGE type electron transport complex subunit A [Nitrospinota bacterium]